MTASSRTALNNNQGRNDETCNVENLEDGNFLALRLDCDRHTHTHHKTVILDEQ